MSKYKAEYLNSEILQNYPKTGKTILGYEKFKKDKNREFNFERSLRNENYMNDFRNKILVQIIPLNFFFFLFFLTKYFEQPKSINSTS